MFIQTILFLVLCMTCNASRHVVKTIRVDNGGNFGEWGKAEYCPKGQMAFGYTMKIEENQGRGDDSALNGIRLICSTMRENNDDSITSDVGPFGDWNQTFAYCDYSKFLTSFRLQVEPYQGVLSDDSSANSIEFRCGSLQSVNEEELREGYGQGIWGTFGEWSESCSKGSAICGIKTRVEGDQGSLPHQDDTGLNDVLFYCCDM